MRLRSIARVGVAALLALVLLGQGISAPFTKDAEPQSAQWIADIVDHGHWLVPVDYYGVVDPKPPLYYWLSATVALASGRPVDEVRARVISLVAGAALAVIVLEWTRACLGVSTGWLAFFFLIGSYGFGSRATTALTDMLMSLWIFAAYCVIGPGVDAGLSPRRTLAAGLLLGLGILTKGPIAIVIPALAAILYLLMSRRNALDLLRREWPWGIAGVALAIAGAWYVPAFAFGGHRAVASIFISENVGHFMPSSMGGTGEAARPVYYIAVRMLGGMIPLSFLVPTIVLAFMRHDFATEVRQPILFQLAMAIAVLILFSAASAKRDDYILPAIAPLAILFAALFTHLSSESRSSGITTAARDVTTAAIAVLMIAGMIAASVGMYGDARTSIMGIRLQSSDAAYATVFSEGLADYGLRFLLFAAAVAIGAGSILVGVWRHRGLVSGSGLAVVTLAGMLLWTGVMRPAEARTRSLVTFAPAVRARVGEAPVYVPYFDEEFAWYYGRGVLPLPNTFARAGAPSQAPIYLVARPSGLARLAPAVRRRLIVIMRADVSGGGGPPSLYQIPSLDASIDLNQPSRAAK